MTVRARSPRLTPRGAWLAAAPLAFLGVFFVVPTLAILARGAQEALGGSIPWSRIADAAGTTAVLASAATLGSLVLGLPATWALFRRSWRGARLAVAAVTVPFVLPTVVVAAAFRAATRGAAWASEEPGVWLVILAALVFFNIAVVVRIVGPVWAALDDRTYWAARTLGASPWRAARTVTLPALSRAIAAAAAAVWLFCSTSFGVVIVIGGGRVATVDTEAWLQTQQFLNLGAAAVLGVLQIAMVATAFALAGLLARRARVAPALAAQRDAPRARGARERVLIVAALVPAGALLALPLVTLVVRSLTTRDGIGLGNYRLLLTEGALGGSGTTAPQALGTSLVTALAVAVIATVLALAMATFIAARPSLAWLHGALLLPLGVSSVVVGLGVLLTLARPAAALGPDIGPRLLIPAAHIVVALPLAVSVILPAVRGIDARLLAAAATLGAGPARVWRTVQWPLARRATFMAAGLCAAVSLGEFGASAFLARPGAQTLPTLMFRLLGRPGAENVGMAFAIAVILALATAAIALAADPSARPARAASALPSSAQAAPDRAASAGRLS